jgi:hypothetical protein
MLAVLFQSIMYIYSGTYRMGLCGENANLKDNYENQLFIGDIVVVSHFDKDTETIDANFSLSAIVSDRFVSYSDGTHVEHNEYKCFIMGLRDADLSEWFVKKVKSFDAVIENENWKEYGFNFHNR